jgi:TetR/AcrR family transcriptional regulator, transcriptional repressor for nem operon
MARPRGFDEAVVLRAIRDCFWSAGYAETSMDDAMAATGLGKGSLYGAFGDKHDLYLRVFDEYAARAIRIARRDLEGPDAGAYDRLRSHVDANVAAAADDTAHRGCLLANGVAELGGTEPAIVARAKETFQVIEELLAECIAGAQRHGDLDAGADAQQLAGVLLAVLRGVEALAKAGSDRQSLQRIADGALASLPRTDRSANDPSTST